MIYKLKDHSISNFFFIYHTAKNHKNFILDIVGRFECDLQDPTTEESDLELDIDMKRNHITFEEESALKKLFGSEYIEPSHAADYNEL